MMMVVACEVGPDLNRSSWIFPLGPRVPERIQRSSGQIHISPLEMFVTPSEVIGSVGREPMSTSLQP